MEKGNERINTTKIQLDNFFQGFGSRRTLITPKRIVFILYFCGLAFLALGLTFLYSTSRLYSEEVEYDKKCEQEANCIVNFRINNEIKGNFVLLYKLSSYFQNHRRIYESLSYDQLRGKFLDYSKLSACSPRISSGSSKDVKDLYAPCGIRALSFFNDSYYWLNHSLEFTEKNIALNSDLRFFKSLNSGYDNSIRFLKDYYNFPDENMNEHFLVWMRSAAMPKFVKVYAKCINCTMYPGNYSVLIRMSYPKSVYSGPRHLVLIQTSSFGSSSYIISVSYLTFGGFSILMATGFLIQMILCPRQFGDLSLIWTNPPLTSQSRTLGEFSRPSTAAKVYDEAESISIATVEDDYTAEEKKSKRIIKLDSFGFGDNTLQKQSQNLDKTDHSYVTDPNSTATPNSEKRHRRRNRSRQASAHNQSDHIDEHTLSVQDSVLGEDIVHEYSIISLKPDDKSIEEEDENVKFIKMPSRLGQYKHYNYECNTPDTSIFLQDVGDLGESIEQFPDGLVTRRTGEEGVVSEVYAQDILSDEDLESSSSAHATRLPSAVSTLSSRHDSLLTMDSSKPLSVLSEHDETEIVDYKAAARTSRNIKNVSSLPRDPSEIGNPNATRRRKRSKRNPTSRKKATAGLLK